METKIYLVNVKATYMKNSLEVDFETWHTYKAFTTREKAVEYTKIVSEYINRFHDSNTKHDIYIKEVELA